MKPSTRGPVLPCPQKAPAIWISGFSKADDKTLRLREPLLIYLPPSSSHQQPIMSKPLRQMLYKETDISMHVELKPVMRARLGCELGACISRRASDICAVLRSAAALFATSHLGFCQAELLRTKVFLWPMAAPVAYHILLFFYIAVLDQVVQISVAMRFLCRQLEALLC